jgi:hypothetical protein
LRRSGIDVITSGLRGSLFTLAILVLGSCSSGAGEYPETESSARLDPNRGEIEAAPLAPHKASPPKVAKEVKPKYPLDRTSRKVPMSGKLVCPPVQLVLYEGELIAYDKPARVYVDFAEHLQRFEVIVRDTAVEIYGRAPTKIRTYGSFYCRRIRTWGYLVSEHGLGNALDVSGFDFGKLKNAEASSVPPRWRRPFAVSMSKHWRARSKDDATHRKFLRLLAQRVIDDEDLFRVILGPADPKHQDHFHFDMAPIRIVNVFD